MAPRKGTSFSRLSQDEIDRIVSLYSEGIPSEDVAGMVGRSSGIVRRILLRLGISRPVGHHLRKYFPREDAFDDAENDPDAAYWVGFLLADMGISPSPGRQDTISLELKIGDRAHVEAFAAFIGLPREAVKDGYGGRQSCFCKVRSGRISKSLARYGITPRKSLTVQPAILTMNRHFWRGVSDGDGCLHIPRRSRKYDSGISVHYSVVGSEDTIRAFAKFAKAIAAPSAMVNPTVRGNLWAWATCGSTAVDVIRCLYEDAPVALARKATLAHRILTEIGPTGYHITHATEDSPHSREPRASRFLTFNGETKSVAEWARSVGLPPITLLARLRYGWSVERALTEPVAISRRKTLTCTHPGCDRPHSSRGLCTMHYKRRRRGRLD